METNATTTVDEATANLRHKTSLKNKEESSVIRISDKSERRQHRHHEANKQAPRININAELMNLLQKPMLNRVPPLPKDTNQTEYLGVLCLKDEIANCRKYHIFCCKDNFVGVSYGRVIAHYRNKPNIKIVNQVTTSSVSALSLLHSVRKHFSNHQWNADRTVFSTDTGYNEWKLMATINEIHRKEMLKFLNYLLLLQNRKK